MQRACYSIRGYSTGFDVSYLKYAYEISYVVLYLLGL